MTQKKFSESGNSPPKLEEMPDLLTIDQLAAFLQCKRRAIYSLTRSRAQDGENPLKILRLPVGLRVRRVDLESWLAAA
jgi:hypothetical protein